MEYIPEYFLGDKINDACKSCKSNDSSWTPDDPFSSFAESSMPSSLASHWLPAKSILVQIPGSISSLVAHYVQLSSSSSQSSTAPALSASSSPSTPPKDLTKEKENLFTNLKERIAKEKLTFDEIVEIVRNTKMKSEESDEILEN